MRLPFAGRAMALKQAKANANSSGEPWIAFIDTGGMWNVEKLSNFSERAEVRNSGTIVHPKRSRIRQQQDATIILPKKERES